MDMASAMGAIRHDDTNNNAAKFTVWPSGYAYKTVLGLTDAEVTAGKYRLVFVQANGDQFVFKWNGVADFTYEGYAVHTGTSDLADLATAVLVTATKLNCDADFMEACCSFNWETGAQATYESRRTGGGVW